MRRRKGSEAPLGMLGATCPQYRRPGASAPVLVCNHLLQLNGYSEPILTAASKINPLIGRIFVPEGSKSSAMYLETTGMSSHQDSSWAVVKCTKCRVFDENVVGDDRALTTGTRDDDDQEREQKKKREEREDGEENNVDPIPGLNSSSQLLTANALIKELGFVEGEQNIANKNKCNDQDGTDEAQTEISFDSDWTNVNFLRWSAAGCANEGSTLTKTYWDLRGNKVELKQEVDVKKFSDSAVNDSDSDSNKMTTNIRRVLRVKRVKWSTTLKKEEEERWRIFMASDDFDIQTHKKEKMEEEENLEGGEKKREGMKNQEEEKKKKREEREKGEKNKDGEDDCNVNDQQAVEVNERSAELGARLAEVEREGEHLYKKLARV